MTSSEMVSHVRALIAAGEGNQAREALSISSPALSLRDSIALRHDVALLSLESPLIEVEFKNLAEGNPSEPVGWVSLADLYRRRCQKSNTRDAIAKALQADPDYSPGVYMDNLVRGDAPPVSIDFDALIDPLCIPRRLLDVGSKRSARKILDVLTRDKFWANQNRMELANIWVAAGVGDEAIKLLQGRESPGRGPQADWVLGCAHNLERSYDRAYHFLAQFLEASPEDPGGHFQLAVAHFGRLEFDRSLHELHIAQQCGYSPVSCDILRCEVWLASGRKDQALVTVRHLAKGDRREARVFGIWLECELKNWQVIGWFRALFATCRFVGSHLRRVAREG